MKSQWYSHGVEREGAKMNIFCFPYAGGTASNFSQIKKYISPDISVFPVLYPMRERRYDESLQESLEALASSFVEENMSLFDKPFMLMGHCTGSLIAYEAALHIERVLGKKPLLFIASASTAPNRRIAEKGIEDRTDDSFVSMLIETGRVTEEAIKIAGFKEYYLPIIRADYSLLSKYHFNKDTKIKCPILSLVGTEDKTITKTIADEWSVYTDKSYDSKYIAGNHYFIDKSIYQVCDVINSALQADGGCYVC